MDLPEGIALLTMTKENIDLLWSKFNEHPKLFMDPERGDKQAFARQLISQDSVYFVYEDVGTIFFTEIKPPYIAKFHLMFWDGKMRGREEICIEMLGWAFEEFDLTKVWTSIPVFAKVQKKFAERIGFLREGYFRKGYPCLGTNYDVYIYGMLREDYNGSITSRGVDLGADTDRLSSGRSIGDSGSVDRPWLDPGGSRGEQLGEGAIRPTVVDEHTGDNPDVHRDELDSERDRISDATIPLSSSSEAGEETDEAASKGSVADRA